VSLHAIAVEPGLIFSQPKGTLLHMYCKRSVFDTWYAAGQSVLHDHTQSLLLITVVGFSESAQCLVPLGLERIGYQPIAGINVHEALTSQV
jgi:hypothetical protein